MLYPQSSRSLENHPLGQRSSNCDHSPFRLRHEPNYFVNGRGFPPPAVTYTLDNTVIASAYVFPIGTNVVTSTSTNSVGTNSCSFTVTVAAGAAPELVILSSGTNVILSWPSLFSCYTLEFTTALANNSWSNYPGPLTTNDGSILVTNAVGAANRFFRLSD